MGQTPWRGPNGQELTLSLGFKGTGVGVDRDGKGWQANLEFAFVEGSDGDLER